MLLLAGFASSTSFTACCTLSRDLPDKMIVYVLSDEYKALTVSSPRPVFAPVMRTISLLDDMLVKYLGFKNRETREC